MGGGGKEKWEHENLNFVSNFSQKSTQTDG